MEQVLFGCLSSSELHPEPWFQPSPFLSLSWHFLGQSGLSCALTPRSWRWIRQPGLCAFRVPAALVRDKNPGKTRPSSTGSEDPTLCTLCVTFGVSVSAWDHTEYPEVSTGLLTPSLGTSLLWVKTKIFTGNRCYLPDLFPAAASNVQLSAVPGSSRCSEFVNTKLCLYRTELLVLVVWCSLKEIREEEQHHQFCCPRSQKQTGEWTLLWSKYFITELCHECHKKNIITFPQRF